MSVLLTCKFAVDLGATLFRMLQGLQYEHAATLCGAAADTKTGETC